MAALTGARHEHPSEVHQVRLFFNRNAQDTASLLSQSYPSLKVAAIGTDLIVFQTTNAAYDRQIHELKRWIALIDSPRPQLALNVWSVQISANNFKAVDKLYSNVKEIVAIHNDQLQQSLLRGARFLDPIVNNADEAAKRPFAELFSGYVLKHYVKDIKLGKGINLQDLSWKTWSAEMVCGSNVYCLGYEPSFGDLMQPTLTSMIGAIAGLKNLCVVNQFVDCLEDKGCHDAQVECATNSKSLGIGMNAGEMKSCDAEDSESITEAPAFSCFRRELGSTLGDTKLKGFLRSAMADFLFNHKFTFQYARDFNSERYLASAQSLDSRLEPLLVAYNRDLANFLRHLQRKITCLEGGDFASDGIVSLRTISGTDAELNTTTQNQFKETPPALIQDFVKQMGLVEKNIPSAQQASMEAQMVGAAAALLNSSQPVNITLGRDLNLKVSPISLKGASAAELKIRLEVKDNGKPQYVSSDGTIKDDSTNRIAQHVIDTNVRVESLKLFEISSFSAELSRGRKPIPLLPPLVDLPYVGSLIKWNRKPATVHHRSLAIISAAVLPTAADLLSGLTYNEDVSTDANATSVLNHPPPGSEAMNKRMLNCIHWEARSEVKGSDAKRNDYFHERFLGACKEFLGQPGTNAR